MEYFMKPEAIEEVYLCTLFHLPTRPDSILNGVLLNKANQT